MPYITKEDRELYDPEIEALVGRLVYIFSSEPTKIVRNRAGHLNYIFTKILKEFYTQLNLRLLSKSDLSYSDHNEIVGMLECCKQEVYRRLTGPYEDLKIKSNGDV